MAATKRITHLTFIQDTITRMANEANTLKAWLVPVVTAAYGYAVIGHSWPVAALGIMASLVFGWQSARYLQQERAFRSLYISAARGEVTPFSMDITDHTVSLWGKRSALWTWSVGGFFGTFVAVGVCVVLYAVFC
ncbi:MAG: hypothetical protein FWD55_00470 [Propionibacteriaceae bacterium]|nr:hypothetical protein [Propionibacteriaceae bacterium]